jgi:AcrR family transcriptional regulator
MTDAAIAVFSELGYERATTRELAERAGVSEGLIYRHFGGKRELLFAALETEREKGMDPVEPLPAGSSLADHIAHIMRKAIDHAWRRKEFVRVCMSLAMIDPELAEIMESIERQGVTTLRQDLQALQREGLIHEAADIDGAASSLNILSMGLAFTWRILFRRSPSQVDKQIEAVVKQFSRALGPGNL